MQPGAVRRIKELTLNRLKFADQVSSVIAELIKVVANLCDEIRQKVMD